VRFTVLAIAGSQRHGNSEALARAALEGAAAEGATTVFAGLAGRRVAPCRGECFRTCHGDTVRPWQACIYRDDAAGILESMVEADGIIFVSPVFHAGIPAPFKNLLDRCNALSRFQDENIFSWLAGKAGGAIAVGGARHAGQEAVLGQLLDFMLSMQMVPVGFGERQGYRGLAALAEAAGAVASDRWVDYGSKPAAALDLARLFGAKVARYAVVLKQGRNQRPGSPGRKAEETIRGGKST
jgi:multimeric flavodoxin WrbA